MFPLASGGEVRFQTRLVQRFSHPPGPRTRQRAHRTNSQRLHACQTFVTHRFYLFIHKTTTKNSFFAMLLYTDIITGDEMLSDSFEP